MIASPAAFRKTLLAWYGKHGRDLPWRRTRDPYAILVSEFMLQQTQVTTVIPFYERWLQRFPSFHSLAAAEESEVLHAWQGLGYYARARNLHAAAKMLARDPNHSLGKLPGVGRYTANAVATFAFDQSVPLVEANIARLLARLTNLQISIDSSNGREQLWNFANSLVPKQNAGRYNSALMDLGATICIARQPKCDVCAIRRFCRCEDPAKLPIKKERAATKTLVEHHSLTTDRGRILLEQANHRWRGMWILPRLPNESLTAPIYTAQFPFTNHRITLSVHRMRAINGRWFCFGEVDSIPIPSPHRRALTHLLDPTRAP